MEVEGLRGWGELADSFLDDMLCTLEFCRVAGNRGRRLRI